MMCALGTSPATLVVLPAPRVTVNSQPAATIMDSKPMTNVPTFGMCMSPANPQVIAATAAALGVFTPQPCIPATSSPWAPGAPTVLIAGQPALTNTSTCQCMWGGVIAITSPPSNVLA
jgi:Domain of unknown function (DUF4280)